MKFWWRLDRCLPAMFILRSPHQRGGCSIGWHPVQL